MRRAILLIMFLTALLGISSMWAATINVPGDYTTIQAAINAAAAGDVINIAAGTYTESLGGWRDFELFKSLSLIGAGSGQTIVQLSGLQNGMAIRGTNLSVTLQGIRFTRIPGNSWSSSFPLKIAETSSSFTLLQLIDVEVEYGYGSNIQLGAAGTYSNVVIQDCYSHHAGSWGFVSGGTINQMSVTDSDFM